MSANLKNLTIFVSLILCIYLLRSTQFSRLQSQVSRILDEKRLIAKFCDGVSLNSTYTDSQHDRAARFRNSIANIRPDDKTLTYFINSDESSKRFGSEYFKEMIPVLVPWLCFFVIGAVGCVVFVVNWCCMNCKCCQRCACRVCLSPKTSRGKKLYIAVSAFFMLMTVGTGIAGLVFSTKVPGHANATICWAVRLMEKINEGSPEENWIGLDPAITSIDTITTNITNAVNGLNVFNYILGNLTTNLDQTTTLVSMTYTENKDVTITRIDPDETTPYAPDYISVRFVFLKKN